MLKKLGLGDFNEFLSKHSDIVLAVLVIAVLGMIIVPLPPFLLDIFLTISISLGVIILLVSLYITDALKLASFPTILLMTTLYRLSLNISTTRLILSQGYAGEVVEAFGNFVASGNFVVGIVLFLIITLVNFIVVAKGAERVSEVAARFTLDAMPGKQMSIDADLRAGTITMEQAQERRRTLQRESQMYGAMDGAMKFVKGDAIAGIVITAINIIGGLLIGVVQHDMKLGEAAKLFTLLTIGDGLVSMLPAFIISMSAGVVVTRVASDSKDTNLGRDIITQMTAYPKVFMIAGSLLIGLGLVPGLPKVPFFILGSLLLAYSFYSRKKRDEKIQEIVAQPKEEKVKKALEKHGDHLPFIMPSPISLEVGSALIPFVDDSKDGGRFINELIPLLRHGLYYELGVNFPGIQVRGQTVDMEAEAYVININEVPVARGKVSQGCILVGEPLEQLQLFNITGKETIHPIDGSVVTWVSEQYKDVAVQAGFRMWDISEYLILHLSYLLRKHAHEFLGLQEVQTLLTELEKSHPALVKELVPKYITVLQLSEVFQRLVQEEVAIRDLKNIFSTLAQWAEIERNTLALTEHIRGGLKRYITHKYAGHTNTLAVYLLDPGIEDMVRDAIRSTEKGNYLALDPEVTQEIIEAVGKEIASHPFPPGAKPPVILTTAEVRRYFRKIIELEFPQLSVLSYQELAENLRIQPIARVNLPRLQAANQ
ncbi:MAG: EscV/YscV/HrcV family type III secretion system export apparatus protein [Deltaproteobacteria bacterium RIFCSPLOWO2_12_FULL_40_28]|nr:MAG: EscV/YscV/HrcV family type III secretion system export apparatus protein [Deltaproteobacteria bacterium RIFCSPHIGHO2_02_FULL_40_28]OGQ19099.1 MAG: EscV/YscV/HrcV family type III secretion system export apparatus protein [Deltaproteobacteria bacterium RIFCSPHIGHO2_12_FULL_40_32]OGQ40271.1 MAG: EscV/YscV/HrcV family type III secretion system export apparatus protein [Deltaproteobacteria bacterium RIFCSPLOWO2_02_FULL_40_36]OGQ53542.1 MAG: EscV/YscV/HrcV family type III secretion system expo